MFPNAPTYHTVAQQGRADLTDAMRNAAASTAIRRLRGLGADEPAKLSWWDTATTPVKVAVVGGGILAVIGLGVGVMALMKKGRRR
jgi:hypothetical protein